MDTERIKARWQDCCETDRRIADLALKHCFVFNAPWDLEPTNRPVFLGETIDWTHEEDGDAEFTYQLNRHRFLLSLARSFRLTGDSAYADGFRALLFSWERDVPLNEQTEKTAWRSLDTGERASNLYKSVQILGGVDFFTAEEKAVYLALMRRHAAVLQRAENDNNLISNWGFFHDHGLFFAALALDDPALARTAAERMLLRFSYQFDADGIHRESSDEYQAAILLFFLDVLLFADEKLLPDGFRDKAQRCADALAVLHKPNGTLLGFGDSDNCDLRDLMTRAAIVLRDGRYARFGWNEPDYDTLWYLPAGRADELFRFDPVPPEPLNAVFSESFHCVMRSDRTARAHFLHFMNPTFGGGHAHCDRLHIDLCIGGRDILTDSGRYTYKTCPERLALKSTAAHNCCTVDGLEPQEPLSSWTFAATGQSANGYFRESEAFVYAESADLSYLAPPTRTVHERRILFIKPNLFILTDVFHAFEAHTYRAYFNFSPDGGVTADGHSFVFTGKDVTAEFFPFAKPLLIEKQTGLYSPLYNVLRRRDRICLTTEGATTQLITVIAERGVVSDIEEVTVDAPARAIRLTANGKRYVFFTSPEENARPYRVGESVFWGRTAVCAEGQVHIIRR